MPHYSTLTETENEVVINMEYKCMSATNITIVNKKDCSVSE